MYTHTHVYIYTQLSDRIQEILDEKSDQMRDTVAQLNKARQDFRYASMYMYMYV